ncbi:protein translocase subunit SecF [Coxiella burnetii]|uniref:Protein-export membrane protein SecF n=1 Tax=Coxiella burnetii (strain RSA 493 / Nine Mile phase I) TaxID=227377 RepID=Q83CH4_COXBU|nr:protein translocase subunit SecF [Coxiella burnetii]NP_820140.1 protein translocase subunit SecF [Coxiella burnetii RSA 493]AAO90654.1 protein translocase subunit [Coxiella burnetii RSA 493]ABX78164.1 protein-export membrane protein SecF [Coxiella burnetii RSA 331]AIT63278.1 Protein-export membrane protein SecF [Coxiella burnetii str. Namibia]AML49415.1 preprotein translocase subunit SecF [Coxiella burnetii]AML55336.1 preprotein translocase subunit SecF [Coxiella burnetii]
MEFFKTNTKIPFMRQRKWAGIFSAIIFLASIITLAVNGLNLGLDFTGGTQVEVNFTKPVDTNQIRKNLAEAGFPQAVVRVYDVRHISVRVAPHKELTQEELKEKLMSAMPGGHIGSLDYIGPQVGKQLMTNGILAVIVALIATMIYIALRFEMRFALSAAIALIHDPVLILGIFSFFHIEFNLIVLAAVLTVIGYSLNDTIVVYDRIRENFRKVRRGTPTEIVDLSINQTLSRTIMTSGLTLIVVLALFIFGGSTLRPFALALIIGIVIGTYSSIYVAGSLAVTFGLSRRHLIRSPKKIEDDLP